MLQALLDRFLTSISFAVYARLMAALSVDAMRRPQLGAGDDVNGHVRLPGYSLSAVLVPLAIAGVVLCASANTTATRLFRGPQSVLGMLAGQGLANLLPIPGEPSFQSVLLAVPNLLLYFGTLGVFGACANRACLFFAAPSAAKEAIGAVFMQYTTLFATLRALNAFHYPEQQAQLALLSTVYMLLPDRILPGNKHHNEAANNHTDDDDDGNAPASFSSTSRAHIVTCVEALAVRSSMLSLSRFLGWCAGNTNSANRETLLILYFVFIQLLLNAPLFAGMRKLTECRIMLSLLCARYCVTLCSERMQLSEMVVLLLWLTIAMLFVVGAPFLARGSSGSNEQQQQQEQVIVFVLSLLLVQRLERFLAGFGALEAFTAYMSLFALLEWLDRSSEAARWKGPQATASSLFFAESAGLLAGTTGPPALAAATTT